MKRIKLTKGRYALVDDEDFEFLQKWSWHTDHDRYAVCKDSPTSVLYMHRLLMNAPKGIVVDHINGDGFDNRKGNLRLCTHGQNIANSKISKNSKTGYKGVSFHEAESKYNCFIQRTWIGYFDNPRHAAIAYDLWAKDLFGEFANTNFKLII